MVQAQRHGARSYLTACPGCRGLRVQIAGGSTGDAGSSDGVGARGNVY